MYVQFAIKMIKIVYICHVNIMQPVLDVVKILRSVQYVVTRLRILLRFIDHDTL
jgi:hypothetical protein